MLCRLRLRILGVVLGASMLGASASDGLDTWTQRSPLPYLWGVAASADRVVAVGREGTILSSADGEHWESEVSGTPAPLYDVAYQGDRFFAVGGAGQILHSVDGHSWAAMDSPTTNTLNGLSLTPELSLICGTRGTLLALSNGTEWGALKTGVVNDLNAVAQGGGLAVAVGTSGSIVYSESGGPWKVAISGTSKNLLGVRFIDGNFIAVGVDNSILVSTNGVVWRQTGTTGYHAFYDAAKVGDRYVVAGSPGQRLITYGQVTTSTTLGGWTEVGPPVNPIYAMTQFGGKLIAVGAGGFIGSSQDGLVWDTLRCSPIDTLWRACEVDGQIYVASYPETIGRSQTGPRLFEPRVTGIYHPSPHSQWEPVSMSHLPAPISVVQINERWVAVGTLGRLWTRTSTSGWEELPRLTTATFTEVAAGPKGFVAVGAEQVGWDQQGIIVSSSDGVAWERVASTFNLPALRRVKFGNGVFIVAGEAALLSSVDGRTWHTRALPYRGSGRQNGLLGLAFGAGRFVGVDDGVLLVSSDGADWEVRSLTGAPTVAPCGIAYGQGWFVVAGKNGGIATSIDGLNWTTRTNLGTNWLRDVAFLGGRFLAVGDEGTVIESAPVAPMPPQWAAVPEGVTVGNDVPIRLDGWTASSEAVQYQWLKDGQPIPGANQTPLTLEHATSAMSGNYRLVASNALGVVSSSDVPVTILDPAPVDSWQVVRFPGTTLVLDRLAHGAGGFVATTTNGTLAWSTNGTHFIPIQIPNTPRFLGVRYVSARFFAVGEAGTVYASADGKDWSSVAVPTDEDLHDIAAIDGTWVIVGKHGTILISRDATSWSRAASPTGSDLHGVCGSDLGLIAVGSGGTILSSFDGDFWFAEDSATTADLWGVASNGETALACGDEGAVVTYTWQWNLYGASATPGCSLREVAVVGDAYYYVGPGWSGFLKITVSPQGLVQSSGSFLGLFTRSAFTGLAPSTNGYFAAVGTAVTSYTTNSGWQLLGGPAYEALYSMADVAGSLVAVGDLGTILSSADGTSWTQESSPTTNHLASIASGPTGGVIVGSGGVILQSDDGHTWRPAESTTASSIVDVCYGDGKFVAADESAHVLISDDGKNWRTHFVGSGFRFVSVHYFSGRYWALTSSHLFQSVDTEMWSSNRISNNFYVTQLADDGETLLLLDSGAVRTSKDGVTWSPRPSTPRAPVDRMAMLGNILVAAVSSEDLWFSANYTNWYRRTSGQLFSIRGIKTLRGSVYAVGQYGVILRSAPNARLDVSRSETPTLRLRDADGRSYRVEYSDSVGGAANWQSPKDAHLTPETPVWSDASASTNRSRFYRAILE
ncbi:MAG: hypothetical protein IT581_09370 [Verrucomicrobiales bacterium]|nr:hypothetical protein [Verrucomicrobiales bacterium]